MDKLIELSSRKEVLDYLTESPAIKELAFTAYPNASFYYGLEYYHLLLKELEFDYPDKRFIFYLNCLDDGALVQRALQKGFKYIIFSGKETIYQKLTEIAKHYDAYIIRASL